MMKITAQFLLILVIVVSCSETEIEEPDVPVQDQILGLVNIDQIRSNGISYSIKGESLKDLEQYDGHAFQYDDQELFLSFQKDDIEIEGDIETFATPRILVSNSSFPKNGDILVNSSVAEYSGGSSFNNCQTHVGGTLVEIKGDTEWGDPNLVLQANVRVNGANGNWLKPSASISRYIGTTSPYQPGNYELISFKMDCRILSSCEDNPLARGRATWSSSYNETYTIIKCDD